MTTGPLRAPEKLAHHHELTGFDCGEPHLNEWLRKRAWANESAGASRTYVVCAGSRVAGFYSLAAGAVAHELAAGKLRRNMPDPIPVLVLGRLGVDLGFQGRGLGSALLRDAILRSLQAAEIAGIRALLVQAKNESARAFYLRSGFFESPIDPMILMILLKDAAKAL